MSASRKWANYTNSALVLATLLLLAVIMVVIPIGWMLITALKERQQIFAWPPVYFPTLSVGKISILCSINCPLCALLPIQC